MTDKDRGVLAAGQPGDRLYKQILFIAALECVDAFFWLWYTPSLISIQVGCSCQQLTASSYLFSNNPHTISKIKYSFLVDYLLWSLKARSPILNPEVRIPTAVEQYLRYAHTNCERPFEGYNKFLSKCIKIHLLHASVFNLLQNSTLYDTTLQTAQSFLIS
jgi:hypothetical protein